MQYYLIVSEHTVPCTSKCIIHTFAVWRDARQHKGGEIPKDIMKSGYRDPKKQPILSQSIQNSSRRRVFRSPSTDKRPPLPSRAPPPTPPSIKSPRQSGSPFSPQNGVKSPSRITNSSPCHRLPSTPSQTTSTSFQSPSSDSRISACATPRRETPASPCIHPISADKRYTLSPVRPSPTPPSRPPPPRPTSSALTTPESCAGDVIGSNPAANRRDSVNAQSPHTTKTDAEKAPSVSRTLFFDDASTPENENTISSGDTKQRTQGFWIYIGSIRRQHIPTFSPNSSSTGTGNDVHNAVIPSPSTINRRPEEGQHACSLCQGKHHHSGKNNHTYSIVRI